jgi:class 3 adenylate cyclase
MDSPPVKYAKSGPVHVAYQVLGNGPVDLVLVRSAISHLEVLWDEPSMAQFLRDLASFSRLILFDKRGTGLSDRHVGVATLDDRMDDIRAVLDAVGSRHAVLFGTLDGAPMSILFAATYPDRASALILWGAMTRGLRALDYPWAPTHEQLETAMLQDEHDWGSDNHIDRITAALAPSRLGDSEFKRWRGRLTRNGASPAEGAALARMNMEIDVRPVLSAIHCPVLVVHATGDRLVPLDAGRYLAAAIPGAQFLEIPTSDHLVWVDPEPTRKLVDAVHQFVDSLHSNPETDRILTTVLFLDVVGSTRRASELGDQAWGRLLGGYLEGARADLSRFRGRLIKTTGDGLLAIFDGPTRAVRCACALRDRANSQGLEVRVGLHSGECLLKDGDVQGIAVHVAARVCEQAGEGDVRVSSTVRDLSVGSEIRFLDRGGARLKGLEGEWRTFSVESL